MNQIIIVDGAAIRAVSSQNKMETADAASGSKIPGKLQTLGYFPRELCLNCEQPCSEREWKFSIEDGVKSVKGEKILQEKKFSKLGNVSYRRSSKRVSCP